MEEKALLVITPKDGELLAKLKSNYNKQIMQYNKLVDTNKRMAKPFQLRAIILYKEIAQMQQQDSSRSLNLEFRSQQAMVSNSIKQPL